MKDLPYFKQKAACTASCSSRKGAPCRRQVVHGVKCWYHTARDDHLRVKKSSLKAKKAGLGLFTTSKRDSGDTITTLKGRTLDKDEVEDLPLAHQAMCIPKDNGKFLDVSKTRSCLGRYVNEAPNSKNANAEIVEVKHRKRRGARRAPPSSLVFEADKFIEPGKEILTDYGKGYPRDYPHSREGKKNYAPGYAHTGKYRGLPKVVAKGNQRVLDRLGGHVTVRRR